MNWKIKYGLQEGILKRKQNKLVKKQYAVKQNVYVKYLSVFTNMLSHTFLGPK